MGQYKGKKQTKSNRYLTDMLLSDSEQQIECLKETLDFN